MKTDCIFFQSRDNTSADIIELEGKPVGETDLGERNRLTRRIGEVTLDGKERFRGKRVTILCTDADFVAKVMCPEQDSVGRQCVIVFCGSLIEPTPGKLREPQDVYSQISAFAGRHALTIEPNVAGELREGLKKKGGFGELLSDSKALQMSLVVLTAFVAVKLLQWIVQWMRS